MNHKEIRIQFCIDESKKKAIEGFKNLTCGLSWRKFIEAGLEEYKKSPDNLSKMFYVPKRNAPISTRINSEDYKFVTKIAQDYNLSISKTLEALIQIGSDKLDMELDEISRLRGCS